MIQLCWIKKTNMFQLSIQIVNKLWRVQLIMLLIKLELISIAMPMNKLVISKQISMANQTMVPKKLITAKFKVPLLKSIKNTKILSELTMLLLAGTTNLLITWSTTTHGDWMPNGKSTKALSPKATSTCSTDKEPNSNNDNPVLSLEPMKLTTTTINS